MIDAFESFFLSCLAIFSNSSFLRGVLGFDIVGEEAAGVWLGVPRLDDCLNCLNSWLASVLLESGDE